MWHLDSYIVAAYLVGIFVAGYLVSRRHAKSSADEFISGGRTRTWYQTSLALIAMAVDPAYMGMAGLGFLWGLYIIQWNAVHIWFTSWFAAMFLIPIYWRSRIQTTPEYLEKRFNVQCRVFFSLVMVVILVVTLTSGLYLGALLLEGLLGWSLWPRVAFIAIVAGFYVILGGMRTVLVLDTFQGFFLLLTLLAVCFVAVSHVGGLSGYIALQATGDAGGLLPSVVPPSDWNLATQTFFPAQAIMLWATVAGLSWLACNFGMAQRLLAAKSEADAQKGLLGLGVLATIACFATYLIGSSMRFLAPDILPYQAFMKVMLEMFPVGARGLLAAGMMAALLSSADGMLTASSALLTEDIYLRFFRPQADDAHVVRVHRLFEAGTLALSVALISVLVEAKSAVTFVQTFYGDVLGVVVALYIVGMFSRRASAKAAFAAMISGLVLAVGMDIWTDWNFAYIGFASFLYALVATLVFSRFEEAHAIASLENLTIHTLPDAKGPWVGLQAWPGLWKWALFLSGGWFGFCLIWEWLVRSS